MNCKIDRAWAEVNLDNIAHNIGEIKRIIGRNTEIMAVVKADAYGHGVMEVAGTVLESGASRLGVSTLDEAIQLRKRGIDAPILIFSYTSPERADEILDFDVTQTVFSRDLAEALSAAAVKKGRTAKIHIKVDTGMARVGFMSGYSAVKNIEEISKLPGIMIEGLFTHFASADEEDRSYTDMQFERFTSIIDELARVGIHIPVKHCCNSAATLRFPEMHLDMVRPGIIIYGLYPSDEVDWGSTVLKPAMAFKANVGMVKSIEPDTFISYGRIFKTARESIIATVPVGYADGFARCLTGKGRILVRGRHAPVVGRICMDQCMIDVTDIEGVSVGDEVVIFGDQGKNRISVEEIAGMMGTINYEVVCIVGKRIPRVYIRGEKVKNVHNYLIDN